MLILKKRGITIRDLFISFIIFIILSLLIIPPYLKLKETANQKSTMLDMEMWGEAISSYIADYNKSPTNPNGRMSYKKEIINELMPYLKAIRIVDRWGNRFWIWTGNGIKKYGIITKNDKDFIISSLGRKGVFEGHGYDKVKLNFDPSVKKKLEDFNKDIVMWNNIFLRCLKQN
jgi:type II secretory pathway pseudopilin PulG